MSSEPSHLDPRTSHLLRVVLAVAVLVMGFGPALVAQQTPTFRASVKLIDIDVIATDKDGKFIRDLTRDDFEILEDGKVQDLQTFSFVDVPAEAVAPAPAPSVPLPEPDTVRVTRSSGVPRLAHSLAPVLAIIVFSNVNVFCDPTQVPEQRFLV